MDISDDDFPGWRTVERSVEHMLKEARDLMEPGEEYDNPEYLRALVNLISDCAGLPMDEGNVLVARALGLDLDRLLEACDAVR